MLWLFCKIQTHGNHWRSNRLLSQPGCLHAAFWPQDLESCPLLDSVGYCWEHFLSRLPLKVNRLSGLMVLASTGHRLAAEEGREKSCLPGWTKGRPDLRLMLPHLHGRRRCCPHCRGVWCHRRCRPPSSLPPGCEVTNLWSWSDQLWIRALEGMRGVTLRLVEDLQRIVTFCRVLQWLRGFNGDSRAGIEEMELRGWGPPSFPAVGVCSWTAELAGRGCSRDKSGGLDRSPGETSIGENETSADTDLSIQPNRVSSSAQA